MDFSEFLRNLLAAYLEIVKAPFKDLSVLWLIIPIVLLWIILELYFDTHKKERLGWNTALGNAISLFWITISLMRYIFSNNREHFSWVRFIAIIIILCYSIFIAFVTFKHLFPAKISYLLASPTLIYFLSGVAILWAYGSLIINSYILLALFIHFLFLLVIVFVGRKLMPESARDEGSPSTEKDDLGKSDFSQDSFGGSSSLGTGSKSGLGGFSNTNMDDLKF